MEFVVMTDKKYNNDVIEFIKKIDKLFPIPLSNKIDIEEYVCKLYKNGKIILAKTNDCIAGIIGGYMNDQKENIAYISILGIDEKYQCKKIGTKLLNVFQQIAKRNKMKKIYLSVNKSNNKGITFYKKNGYELSGKCITQVDHDYTLVKYIKDNTNILLTSVGRRGYLVKYFKDVIGSNGKVFVSNSSDISPAFNYADAGIITPLIYDDNYIDFLLDFCILNEIDAIISLFDIDLPILAKNRKKFEEKGIRIIISDSKVLDICNDKYKTYLFLQENGFNTKKTYINLNDAINDINNNIIHFPLILKPRWGMGSISILEADNEMELKTLYHKVINNINNSYLKYESQQDINESVLIQEKIIGKEYGLDIINDLDKNYQNTIVKKKIAMRSGETDCAVVINDKKLQDIGQKISKKIKHIANMDVDIMMEGNDIYILELNARFGGGYPFSHVSGVNLPYAIVHWIKGDVVDKEYFIPKEYNRYIHKDINIVKLDKEYYHD